MARKMPRRLFVQPHTSIDTGKQERDVLTVLPCNNIN